MEVNGWHLATGTLAGALVGCLLAVARARRRTRRLEAAFDTARQQLEQMQGAFHRFVPERVVDEVIQRGVSTRGERRDVTILFADLVGFTAMSEQTDPRVVVEILNRYFQAMSRAIADCNGHVSKFMGDGLMAIFGAPDPNPWQTMDAVRAAVAMRSALHHYNRSLTARGLPALRVSMGIHTGAVIAGVIGSLELVEYTVIGDVVNTAARIESLTRVHGVDLLISAPVRATLDHRFIVREMSAATVKGKADPIVTFAVDGIVEASPRAAGTAPS